MWRLVVTMWYGNTSRTVSRFQQDGKIDGPPMYSGFSGCPPMQGGCLIVHPCNVVVLMVHHVLWLNKWTSYIVILTLWSPHVLWLAWWTYHILCMRGIFCWNHGVYRLTGKISLLRNAHRIRLTPQRIRKSWIWLSRIHVSGSRDRITCRSGMSPGFFMLLLDRICPRGW